MLNMGFMPKKTGFVFLKVQNRPKNPIFVPENLSIYILDLVCCGILQSDVFSDCQAQTHRSQVL